MLTLNLSNGYYGSQFYNTIIENQTKKQISEISWRFDNFKNETIIFLEDENSFLNTSLHKDKDHFTLNLIFDQPKEFIKLKRFKPEFSNDHVLGPDYFSSLKDLNVKKYQKEVIVGFKKPEQKCYEFYDRNSSLNHSRSELFKFTEPLNDNNVFYYKNRFNNNYVNNKYYNSFNKISLFDETEYKKDICYIYQSAKRFLANKDYENLIELSETTVEKIKYFTDFHGDFHVYERFNLYLWKPIFIGILLSDGEKKDNLLNKLKPSLGVKKYQLYFEEAKKYIKENNI